MSVALTSYPRLKLPATAAMGEVIEISTLLEHTMETGLRKTPDGQPIARDMLASFRAEANDAPVLNVDFHNATSANPSLVFHARISAPTDFKFVWTHEDGRSINAVARVEVK